MIEGQERDFEVLSARYHISIIGIYPVPLNNLHYRFQIHVFKLNRYLQIFLDCRHRFFFCDLFPLYES